MRWNVIGTDAYGRPTEVLKSIDLPEAPSDHQIFDAMLGAGHIVKRSQRPSYRFKRLNRDSVQVIFHALNPAAGRREWVTEYILHKQDRGRLYVLGQRRSRHPKAGY